MADKTPQGVVKVTAPTDEPSTMEKEETMAVKESASPESVSLPLTPTALFENTSKWLEMSTKNMESMFQASQGALKYVLACQQTTLTFAVDRMHKNQDAARACFGRTDPAGLVHASADYHRTMVEDYARYGKQIADMGLATVNEHVGPLQKRAQATLSDVSKVA